MESRQSLVVCALAIATLSCSDAVPPPASLGMSVNLYGITNVQQYVPEAEAAALLHLNLQTSPTALDAMKLLEDGEESSDVKCRVKELVAGSSYEISATYQGERALTQYSLSATTMANGSAAGRVSVKTPLTAGETYAGNACVVETAHAKEGGGAIVAHFECSEPGPLNNTTNCAENAPDCEKRLEGDIFVFLKNCSK